MSWKGFRWLGRVVRLGAAVGSPYWAQAAVINPDLATATASTADSPAASAFDGNVHTRWASSALDNQWILVDMGADYTLNLLTLDWETAHSRDYTIRLRTSDQGLDVPVNPTNWTVIASITGRSGITDGSGGTSDDQFVFSNGTYNALVGSYSNATVSPSPRGRYLMIYGTARATLWGHSLWEVSMEGVGVGGALAVTSSPFSSAVDLSRVGTADWHLWLDGAGAYRTLPPAEQKAGGSLIRPGLAVSYTQDARAGVMTNRWSDGTPDLLASTNTMLKMREATPSSATFKVDLPKGFRSDIHVWCGCWALTTNRTLSVVAAYPDGTAATQALAIAVNDTQFREYLVSCTPDAATMVQVTVASSGESELYLGGVAVECLPLPTRGTVLMVQ